MAHQFSVEIHDFLTTSMETARQALRQAQEQGRAEEAGYLEGRLEELQHLRELLSARYDLRFHKYY